MISLTPPVAASEDEALNLFFRTHHVDGSCVLEVGGCASLRQVRAAGVKRWVSIDPVNASVNQAEDYSTIRGSAAIIPEDDGSFDFVFSSNAFEHISDLAASLREMRRVMKPGGLLHAHFGPIWSGPDGHHLEMEVDGKSYRFWMETIVPPWLHRVVGHAEFAHILSEVVPQSHARAAADFVYHSNGLNRFSFEDFLREFSGAGFGIKDLWPIETVDYEFRLPAFRNEVACYLANFPTERDLGARFGLRGNLSCRDMLVHLVADAGARR